MSITFSPRLDDVLAGKDDDKLIVKHATRNGRDYVVVKYNKKALTKTVEDVKDTGRFRSVVLEDGRVRCVAPPKSLGLEDFVSSLSAGGCRIEQLVEGTMINLFREPSAGTDGDLGGWEIATRSSVGAEVRFFSWTDKTFRQMFIEALSRASGSDGALSELDPAFVYSIVLQHPENRIVSAFSEPSLYLVAAYRVVDDGLGVEADLGALQKAYEACPWLRKPIRYATGGSDVVQELRSEWESGTKHYQDPGIMLHDDEAGTRSKVRNPAYEYVRRLRGNQPKLQYRYLSLSDSERSDYLRYYPEAASSFREYSDQVDEFVRGLHAAYMRCKVRHDVTLSDLPSKFRTHVYQLHGEYLSELRPRGQVVTRDAVRNYVKRVPTALLMHGINRP
jgi:hypothetical protein